MITLRYILLLSLPMWVDAAPSECSGGQEARRSAPAAKDAPSSPAGGQAAGTLQFGRRAASTVIVRDHVGTPWSVGETLEEATRAMTAAGSDGPLFIRHEGVLLDRAPASASATASGGKPSPHDAARPNASADVPRISVGFFVRGASDVAAPFRVEQWPATRTVRLRLGEPTWRTPTAIQRFTEQVRTADLRPGPDIIEVMEVDADGQSVTYLEAALQADEAPTHKSPPQAHGSTTESQVHPTALTGNSIEVPVEESSARRSVLTMIEHIDRGTDPGPLPDVLAPTRVGEPASDVRADEPALRTGAGSHAPPTDAEPSEPRAAASKALEFLRTGDIKRLAESLLPPGRYSKTRRVWIARLLIALDDLATTAHSPMPTLSRDVARVRRMLKQQVERIKLELPEVTAADMRSRLRHDEGVDFANDVLHQMDRLTNDISQHRMSVSEARTRWEELVGDMATTLGGS